MKTILSKALTLSLTLGLGTMGCASEGQPNDKPTPNNRQQSVQSADAASRLLALSNATVSAGQIGQRQNFVFDLEGEIDAGVNDFLDSLTDESCADVDVTTNADGDVHVAFSFDACASDVGLSIFSGNLDIDITATDDEVELDFDCDGLSIDGAELAGEWGIDIGVDASAVISGSVSITVPGFEDILATLEGSWESLDGECPELTQSIEVVDAEGSTSVNLDGVNLCDFSMCNDGLDIEVVDADGSTTSVDFENGEVSTDEATVSIPCGEDGLPDWDTGDYGDDDLPDLEDLPEVPGDDDGF